MVVSMASTAVAAINNSAIVPTGHWYRLHDFSFFFHWNAFLSCSSFSNIVISKELILFEHILPLLNFQKYSNIVQHSIQNEKLFILRTSHPIIHTHRNSSLLIQFFFPSSQTKIRLRIRGKLFQYNFYLMMPNRCTYNGSCQQYIIQPTVIYIRSLNIISLNEHWTWRKNTHTYTYTNECTIWVDKKGMKINARNMFSGKVEKLPSNVLFL